MRVDMRHAKWSRDPSLLNPSAPNIERIVMLFGFVSRDRRLP
jgi:hypothetical protein